MRNIEDLLFWRLAQIFITEEEYRIVKLSKEQNELWLEKKENKKAPIIRLLRHDVDWGNWLQRDIERTAMNGEAIRKQIGKRELNVLNLYMSTYPPVDDYEFRLEDPFAYPHSKKTVVTSLLFERAAYQEQLQRLKELFGIDISIPEDFDEGTIQQIKNAALSRAVNRSKKERSLFDYGKPFFTYFFIVLQVLMFIVLEFSGGSTNTKTLVQFGAKFNPLILEGEWWRFFTPIILHIGFLHLAMNTLALFYLGTAVERIFGRMRFLFIYIAAGFGGSIASFLFSPSISAGASGAIFGCFGALLYFGLIYPRLFFRTMGLNIFIVLAINLAFGFTVPGIDNAGHIGGLIGGFLATGIVHFPKKKRWLLQGGFLLLSLLLSISILRYGYSHPQAVLDEMGVLMLSQDYIEEEQYERAYELLQALNDEEELTAPYYFLLSFVEIKLNLLEDAKESLLQAIQHDPNLHEAHYNLALVYLDFEEVAEAKKHAERAVEIEPNNRDYVELLNKFP